MELVPGNPLAHYGASVTGELKEPGAQIGRFEIKERLSVTLLGALYRVHVRPAGGVRLLQVLPEGLTRDPNLRPRLETRVETLSKMNSEAVMAPREVVDFGNTLAITYDDHSGSTFAVLRAQGGKGIPESLSEVRAMLKQLVLSIEVASGVGAHHFALTPDFVFVPPGGGVKIWGFGVMEVLDRRQFEIFVSSAIVPLKRVEEDPDYTIIEALSPEWRNDEAIDVRADLFGLGVLAFNLIARRRIALDDPKPSSLREGVSAGWDYFVQRLTESDTQNRYQTLVAVSTDLERVERLGGGGANARTTGALGRLHLPDSVAHRMSRRARTLVQILGIVIILALIGGGYLLFQKGGLGADQPEEPEIVLAVEMEPNFSMHISPARARVRFKGERETTHITTNGELSVWGEPRAYHVIVEARGYENAELDVTLSDQLVEKYVDLDPAAAKLRVYAPPGSRVDVRGADGKASFLDLVPAGGVLEIEDRLLAQDYDLVISHELYHPMEFLGTDLQAGEWVDLHANLEPYKVELQVRSDPPGAAVQINGVVVGSTPLRVAEVPVNRPVDLLVGGGELRTWRGRVQPKLDGPNIVDVGALEATRGTLQINLNLADRPPTAEELADLRLEIAGDTFFGVEALKVSVPAGRQDIRIEHPDYLTKIGEVSLRDEHTTYLEVNLSPRPAEVAITGPERRQVYVTLEGKRSKLAEGTIQIEPGRDVAVRIEALDYLPIEKTLHLAANARTQWTPDWERLPGPQPNERWTVPRLDLDLVWAPPGRFEMGSPLTEPMRYPNEGPLTRMRITSGFWVSATEVTQEAYAAIMGENPSRYNGPEHPVDSVSWNDANEFCKRLNAREKEAGRLPAGYAYRLPTEAEWEYAARAGARTAFHFGDRANGGEEHFQGRYPRDYSNPETAVANAGSVPVGQSQPNAWGLYDVHGNVREWTLDAYNDRLPGGEQTDYRRRGEGRGKPVRGGSWSDLADRCRFAARESVSSEIKRPFIGFRLVLAPYR